MTEVGASVVLSDLYQMNFDPVIKQSDYQERAVPDHFKIPYENRNAALKGKTCFLSRYINSSGQRRNR